MIAANSTDGPAAVRDVTILADDRHYFPPYDCAVVAREESLARYPGLRGALEQLSGKAECGDDAAAQSDGGWRAASGGTGGGAVFGFGAVGLVRTIHHARTRLTATGRTQPRFSSFSWQTKSRRQA
jgi:hypothetical protein